MTTDNKGRISPKQKWSRILSLTASLLGTLLLIFMITVEDEFGALPLLLLLGGLIWFILTQRQIRRQVK